MKEDDFGIIVIGSGGHAKVCIEILRDMGELIDYCIGGIDSLDNCLGVPVVRGDDNLQHLRNIGYSRVFIAIGSNQLRDYLAKFALEQGYDLVNAISPRAVVSPSATLGVGIAIMAGVVINAEAIIEDLSIVNTGTTIDHDCFVGRGSHIAPQCALAGNVKVGSRSFLGIGSKVLPGVSVGTQTIIGAGSVVISDIGSNVTAVGVPARVIKSIEVEK